MLENLTFKRLFMMAAFFLVANILHAQKTVTGTVKTPDGQPIVGATVAAKGTKVATQTNAEGFFSLAVPGESSRLTVTSVGFEQQEISVAGVNSVALSLKVAA